MIRLCFYGLITLLVLAPLPFAGNLPWAWNLYALWIGAMLLLWGIAVLQHPSRYHLGWHRLAWIAIPFLLAAGMPAVQASGLVPVSWTASIWADASMISGNPAYESDPTVSLDPTQSVSLAIRLLAYGAVFWLFVQLCRREDRARKALWALAIAGLAYASYGLFIQFADLRQVLWYDKTFYQIVVTSTFINRNHFATYAGLILLVAIALFVMGPTRNDRSTDDLGQRFDRTGALLGQERFAPYFLTAVGLALVTAIMLTGSRAGVASTALAVFSMVALVTIGRRRYGFWVPVAAIGGMVIAGLGILLVSGDTLLSRLAVLTADSAGRLQVYQLMIDAIKENALFGTGYGTFPSVFFLYRDAGRLSHDAGHFTEGHNVFLETVMELGMPAAGALGIAWIATVIILCRGLGRRHRGRAIPALGLAATVLVAVHGIVDFSLQMPAVAITYMALLGLTVAQTWPSSTLPPRRTAQSDLSPVENGPAKPLA